MAHFNLFAKLIEGHSPMGIRFVFFILVLLLIGWIVRFLLSQRKSAASAQYKPAMKKMAQCAWCGVHFPLDEALHEAGHVFCSEAHQRHWHQQNKDA